jgi:hypothetical protein
MIASVFVAVFVVMSSLGYPRFAGRCSAAVVTRGAPRMGDAVVPGVQS